MKKMIRLQSQLVPSDIGLLDAKLIHKYCGAIPMHIALAIRDKLAESVHNNVLLAAKMQLYSDLEVAHKETISIIDNIMSVVKKERKNG